MKYMPAANELKRAYPPMRQAFAGDMRALMDALPEDKKEIVMKKKVSLGLVLAIVLIIAALATAVALSLPRAFFEDVGKMQVESGYYEDWTLDEKLGMLALMEKYGVSLDKDVAATARDQALPQAAREAALDAFMAEKYGIYGRIDVISLESILIAEKGDMVYWSVEDKAWYVSFQKELGLLSSEEERLYTLPVAGERTQEEAEALARGYAQKQLGWTDAQLSGCTAYFACLSAYPDPQRLWEVTLINAQDEGAYITFPAARDNTPEEAEILLRRRDTWREDMDKIVLPLIEKYGPMNTWGLEAKHEYMPDLELLPDASDLTPEQAVLRAAEEVAQAFPQVTREQLLALHADITLRETALNAAPGEGTRTYSISFQNEKYRTLYVSNIDSRTGEGLKTLDYTTY